MSEPTISNVFRIEGVNQDFSTKAEVEDYLRRPKVLAALMAVTANNSEMSEWLLANQEVVEDSFDTGTVKRVTKQEKKKLGKDADTLKELVAGGFKDLPFISENIDAIVESFKWPAVKRLSDEDKAAAVMEALSAAGSKEVAEWIIANKDPILAAFEAGKKKRVANAAGQDALLVFRASKALEKKAAELECTVEEVAANPGEELLEKFTMEDLAKGVAKLAEKAEKASE